MVKKVLGLAMLGVVLCLGSCGAGRHFEPHSRQPVTTTRMCNPKAGCVV